MFIARIASVLGRRARLAGLALAAVSLAATAFIPATPALARSTIMIGTEEVLRPLQDVGLQTGRGEPLYLGYKLSLHWLGLPYAVSNDGYVLGVRGKSSYLEIDAARIAQWQAQGHLPSPLPAYRLRATDYLLGNLLWIVLAGVLAWAACRMRSLRPMRPASPSRTQAPLPAQRLAQATGQAPPPRPAAAAPDQAPPVSADDPAPRAANRMPVTAQMQPVPVPPAQVARMPVAKTICRVKAMRTA